MLFVLKASTPFNLALNISENPLTSTLQNVGDKVWLALRVSPPSPILTETSLETVLQGRSFPGGRGPVLSKWKGLGNIASRTGGPLPSHHAPPPRKFLLLQKQCPPALGCRLANTHQPPHLRSPWEVYFCLFVWGWQSFWPQQVYCQAA